MKSLPLSVLLFAFAFCSFGQLKPNRLTTNAEPTVEAFLQEIIRGTNVMVIDQVYGNDSLAITNPYGFPWRTVYDITTTNSRSAYGALTLAKAGDTIVFNPSYKPYYVPSIPLNYTNSSVNLVIPYGVTIVRTNFSNTNGTGQLPGYLGSVGPLIIPGTNSIIVINGIVIATNQTSSDAAFGWAGAGAGSTAFAFISNTDAPTNVLVMGRGTLVGSSDGVYISANASGGGVTFNGIRVNTSWDGLYFVDLTSDNPLATALTIVTEGLNVNTTTNANTVQASHGAVVRCGSYTDYGSVFISQGGTASSQNNASMQGTFSTTGYLTNNGVLRSGTLRLYGTTLRVTGDPTNSIPLYLQNATVYGDWAEYVSSNKVTTWNASDYSSSFVSSNYVSSTNIIQSVVSPGVIQATGPFTWDAGVGAYRNPTATGNWVSNNVPGDANYWLVRTATGGGTIKYYSTSGLFGVFNSTNGAATPAPIYAPSNWLSVVVTRVPFNYYLASSNGVVGTNVFQPMIAWGSLMCENTNLINGGTDTYAVITNYHAAMTNNFIADKSSGLLTNLYAGFYRVGIHISGVSSNNSAWVEGDLLLNGVVDDDISFQTQFDNPPRMKGMSALGIVYIPANTQISFQIKSSGANGIWLHRAQMVVGTP